MTSIAKKFETLAIHAVVAIQTSIEEQQRTRSRAMILVEFSVVLFIAFAVYVAPQLSSAEDLPWVTPLCRISTSLSGPVTNTIALIVIVLTGLALAVGEVQGILKTLLQAAIGISIAVLASSWLSTLFTRNTDCTSTG